MREKLHDAGCYSVIATCFFIPISTSLMGGFAILSVLFWLVSGKCLSFWQLLKSNIVASLSVLLFVLFICGMFYTSASQEEALYFLKKYRELLFLPVVIALMAGREKEKEYALNAFWAGCFVLLCASFAMWIGLMEPRHGVDNNAHFSLMNHIPHSVLMALFAYWAGHKIFKAKQLKYIWVSLFLLIAFNLFFIGAGRTGMLIFLPLMMLLLWQNVSGRMVLAGGVVISLLLPALYYLSPNFSARVNAGSKDIIGFYKSENHQSSLGLRLYWQKNSIKMIKEKPLFGFGTGSFKQEHYKRNPDKIKLGFNDPHNEFLLIAVQLGLVGLSVWLVLLTSQWVLSFSLPYYHQVLAQGLLITMIISGAVTSSLLGSLEAHMFAFLSGILFSSKGESS